MARSLKDIGREKDTGKIGQHSFSSNNAENAIHFENRQGINELIERYSGKSDDELMHELMRVTSQQKREGTLDSAQIDAAANSILPMLNEEQAKKLQSILSAIK